MMESHGKILFPHNFANDFSYFVDHVKLITSLYDKAIENTTEDENDMALINMPVLRKCQRLTFDLLKDVGLPPEHRILLCYYMATGQDKSTTIRYLNQALKMVRILERLDGKVDPMREILEAELSNVKRPGKRHLCPDRSEAHKNRFVDCSPRKEWTLSTPKRQTRQPGPRQMEPNKYYCVTCDHSGKINPDDEDADKAHSANHGHDCIDWEAIGEAVREEVGDFYTGETDERFPELYHFSAPRTRRRLGDGLVFDDAMLAQFTDSSSTTAQGTDMQGMDMQDMQSTDMQDMQGMDMQGITYDQPSIVVTDTDTDVPTSRPAIIQRIQDATSRRQMELLESHAEEEHAGEEYAEEEHRDEEYRYDFFYDQFYYLGLDLAHE